jgi:hypothetical protein
VTIEGQEAAFVSRYEVIGLSAFPQREVALLAARVSMSTSQARPAIPIRRKSANGIGYRLSLNVKQI